MAVTPLEARKTETASVAIIEPYLRYLTGPGGEMGVIGSEKDCVRSGELKPQGPLKSPQKVFRVLPVIAVSFRFGTNIDAISSSSLLLLLHAVHEASQNFRDKRRKKERGVECVTWPRICQESGVEWSGVRWLRRFFFKVKFKRRKEEKGKGGGWVGGRKRGARADGRRGV